MSNPVFPDPRRLAAAITARAARPDAPVPDDYAAVLIARAVRARAAVQAAARVELSPLPTAELDQVMAGLRQAQKKGSPG